MSASVISGIGELTTLISREMNDWSAVDHRTHK
jgi:hypothetical protein